MAKINKKDLHSLNEAIRKATNPYNLKMKAFQKTLFSSLNNIKVNNGLPAQNKHFPLSDNYSEIFEKLNKINSQLTGLANIFQTINSLQPLLDLFKEVVQNAALHMEVETSKQKKRYSEILPNAYIMMTKRGLEPPMDHKEFLDWFLMERHPDLSLQEPFPEIMAEDFILFDEYIAPKRNLKLQEIKKSRKKIELSRQKNRKKKKPTLQSIFKLSEGLDKFLEIMNIHYLKEGAFKHDEKLFTLIIISLEEKGLIASIPEIGKKGVFEAFSSTFSNIGSRQNFNNHYNNIVKIKQPLTYSERLFKEEFENHFS